MEQTDNSLPGQLLRVAKFNQKSGLSTIVYPYYNWKRYQTDVSDSPGNLMDQKSHCLGLSEELLEEVHCLCLTEDLIGEVLIESGKFLVCLGEIARMVGRKSGSENPVQKRPSPTLGGSDLRPCW